MPEMPSDLAALIDQHGAQLDRQDFERLHKPAHDRSVRLLRAIAASAGSGSCSVMDVMLSSAWWRRAWYECACLEWSSIRAVRCAHNDGKYFGVHTIDRYLPLNVSDGGNAYACKRLTYRRGSFGGPQMIAALHPHPLERDALEYECACDVCDREIHWSELRDTLSCETCGFDVCSECGEAARSRVASGSAVSVVK